MYKLKKYAFQNEFIALASFTVLASAIALWSHFNQSKITRMGQLDAPVDPLDSTTSALVDDKDKDDGTTLSHAVYAEPDFDKLEAFKTYLESNPLKIASSKVPFGKDLIASVKNNSLLWSTTRNFKIDITSISKEPKKIVLENTQGKPLVIITDDEQHQNYLFENFQNLLRCNDLHQRPIKGI